ncbi:MAG: type II toxin-antitoxin system HicB family antitoxin [Deltaproteobacteria bacterium]|nr:type II toxin-antitoxin system HicB family antitoxin [Deltaproteobacteria bacterium]
MTVRYSVTIRWSDEDEAYVATVPELPGLSAFGDTEEEALKELEIAQEAFLDVMRERGDPIPEPRCLPAASGQLRLRMPKSLHAELAEAAAEDGVSLNSYILTLLSARHAAKKSARGRSAGRR